MMRSSTLGAVLALLLTNDGVQAERRFPLAKRGNGFLSVPVGTVDKPSHIVKRQDGEGNPIATVLENMDFFYATESK